MYSFFFSPLKGTSAWFSVLLVVFPGPRGFPSSLCRGVGCWCFVMKGFQQGGGYFTVYFTRDYFIDLIQTSLSFHLDVSSCAWWSLFRLLSGASSWHGIFSASAEVEGLFISCSVFTQRWQRWASVTRLKLNIKHASSLSSIWCRLLTHTHKHTHTYIWTLSMCFQSYFLQATWYTSHLSRKPPINQLH